MSLCLTMGVSSGSGLKKSDQHNATRLLNGCIRGNTDATIKPAFADHSIKWIPLPLPLAKAVPGKA